MIIWDNMMQHVIMVVSNELIGLISPSACATLQGNGCSQFCSYYCVIAVII